MDTKQVKQVNDALDKLFKEERINLALDDGAKECYSKIGTQAEETKAVVGEKAEE